MSSATPTLSLRRSAQGGGHACKWCSNAGRADQIQGCTYERTDLQQRCLGLIADEVEEAIDQLAIDNVLGTKWHQGEDYKTLDYSRLVALLIPAVNHLSQQVKYLQSKVNGTA